MIAEGYGDDYELFSGDVVLGIKGEFSDYVGANDIERKNLSDNWF
jgi:hypothetical protein